MKSLEKRELEQIESKISHRLEQIEDAATTSLNTIEKVRLPEWRVAYLSREYSLSEDIEYPISELVENYGIDGEVFLGKIGVSISTFDLNCNKFDRYSGVFMILEDEDKIAASETIFPSREYLRIRFKGTHMEAAHYIKNYLYI